MGSDEKNERNDTPGNYSQVLAAVLRYLNATWLHAVVSGVVWYYAGWIWALIPIVLGIYAAFESDRLVRGESVTEDREDALGPSSTDPLEVVQVYGKFLETSSPRPGTVADANKLPYPKQKIKEAIIAALHRTNDPTIKEHLKGGYICLSDWQEGVGEKDQGIDLLGLDMSQGPEVLKHLLLEYNPESEKWTDLAKEELLILREELRALGLW